MKRAWMLAAVAVAAAAFAGGCNHSKLSLGKLSLHKAPQAIAPITPAERRAAADLQHARTVYHARLEALRDSYQSDGQLDKLDWAQRELDNLDAARTFVWTAMPELKPQPLPAEPTEAGRVERVITAREAYTAAVDALLLYYQGAALDDRAALARAMRNRFDPVKTYRYFLDAEVPPAGLHCDQLINDADRLYAQAFKLHALAKGWGPLHIGADRDAQRRALARFREIADRHPRSSRMPMVAWHVAEIYRTYFDEDARAALWYQRSAQWDPNIQVPARFEAARLYDRKLQDPDKALTLYRAAMQHETFAPGNMKTAAKRIEKLADLSADGIAPPDTMTRLPEGKDISIR